MMKGFNSGVRSIFKAYNQVYDVNGGLFKAFPSMLWVLSFTTKPTYMGQFPEDGNFGGFMSNFFFKQKATVAKLMDIDDFY